MPGDYQTSNLPFKEKRTGADYSAQVPMESKDNDSTLKEKESCVEDSVLIPEK